MGQKQGPSGRTKEAVSEVSALKTSDLMHDFLRREQYGNGQFGSNSFVFIVD